MTSPTKPLSAAIFILIVLLRFYRKINDNYLRKKMIFILILLVSDYRTPVDFPLNVTLACSISIDTFQ